MVQVQNKALQKLIQYYHLNQHNVAMYIYGFKLIELFIALLQQGNINP